MRTLLMRRKKRSHNEKNGSNTDDTGRRGAFAENANQTLCRDANDLPYRIQQNSKRRKHDQKHVKPKLLHLLRVRFSLFGASGARYSLRGALRLFVIIRTFHRV